jgi:putative transposase
MGAQGDWRSGHETACRPTASHGRGAVTGILRAAGCVLSVELFLQWGMEVNWPSRKTKRSPFRYFKTSPEIIRLAVMLYIRLPLLLRNVEQLLHERGIEISHVTVRFWSNRIGQSILAGTSRQRTGKVES